MDSARLTIRVDPDLKDLIPGFMRRRRDDVEVLRRALDANDLDKIRISGHSMKGTGAGYGFDEISEIGRNLENAALAADTKAITREIERLANYLARVDVVFE